MRITLKEVWGGEERYHVEDSLNMVSFPGQSYLLLSGLIYLTISVSIYTAPAFGILKGPECVVGGDDYDDGVGNGGFSNRWSHPVQDSSHDGLLPNNSSLVYANLRM